MGKMYAKEKLFHDIDCNNIPNIRYILNKYPQILNEYFDKTESSTPLTRTAWLGNIDVLNVLIENKV